MPVWDWQFIVVTLVAAGGFWTLLRRFVPSLPRRRRGAAAEAGPLLPPQSAACAHCASNPSSPSHQPQRQPSRTATVPVVALNDLRDSARQSGRQPH